MKFKVLQAFRDKHGRTIDSGRTLKIDDDAEASRLVRLGWLERLDDPPPLPAVEEPTGSWLVVAQAAFQRGIYDRPEWTFQPGSLALLPAKEARDLIRSGHARRLDLAELLTKETKR